MMQHTFEKKKTLAMKNNIFSADYNFLKIDFVLKWERRKRVPTQGVAENILYGKDHQKSRAPKCTHLGARVSKYIARTDCSQIVQKWERPYGHAVFDDISIEIVHTTCQNGHADRP